jgi:hypothetical protein
MTSRRLTTILATTLTAVTAPQLAGAAQPEGDAGGSAGVSAGASLGTETEPDTSATASGSGSDGGSASGGGDTSGTTSGAPVVVSNVDFLVQPSFLNYLDIDSGAYVSPLYGLGFGYGVHKNFVIGAKFGFNFVRVRNRDEELIEMDILEVERRSNGFFTPYFEYLPIATGRILPFLGARAGVGWATPPSRPKSEGLGATIDAGERSSQLGPLVGLNAGAHFFLTPSFSLDAAALFDTRWNFGRTRDLGDSAAEPPDWAPSNAVMSLGLTLGLSGWF